VKFRQKAKLKLIFLKNQMIFEVFSQGVILFFRFLEIGVKKSNQLKYDD